MQKGMDRQATRTALHRALNAISSLDRFDHEQLEGLLGDAGEELSLSRRQFFGALRVAATGRTVSPPLFETMEVLGKDEIVRRLRSAVERLGVAA